MPESVRGLRLLAGVLAVGAGSACAQTRVDRPLWELGMGAGALRLPHYRGSDQSRSWLLPVPYAVYRGEIFRADREGARALLVDAQDLNVDLSVAASAPTRSSDNQARQGMPDLAPTVEFGPNLNLTLARGADWKLQFRLPLRAAFTLESNPRTIGALVSPNLNLDSHLHGWNIGVLAGPIIATRRFNAYYYDVEAAYATAARPEYHASGGAGGWRAIVGASRRIGNVWMGAFANFDTVGGARFESSPLVKQRHTTAFGVALAYVFAASDKKVPSDD